MSMSRSTGKFLLIENGQIGAEKYSEEIIEYMRNIPVQVIRHTLSSDILKIIKLNLTLNLFRRVS